MRRGTVNSPANLPVIRILIADDHGIVRDGLTLILEGEPRMKVVGAAATGDEAVRLAKQLEPEIVVMDLVMPGLGGVDAIARIIDLLPNTRIVVLSVCRSSEHVFRALRAGARGYVLKDAAGTELVRAVTAVANGHRYLSSEITTVVIEDLMSYSSPRSPLERLSRREREVLHLTVGGSSSAEIGESLSLSRRTVDTYRSRVMQKLGVENLTGLIHFAVEHALAPG